MKDDFSTNLKGLFNELSNAKTEKLICEIKFNEAKKQERKAKRDIFYLILNDSFVYNGNMRKLLWQYGVSRNYGIDVDMEDLEVQENLVINYMRDIYCINITKEDLR